MVSGRGVRALGAVAVALVLLTGTGASYAGWSDSAEVGTTTTVTSGALRTDLQGATVSVRRGGTVLPGGAPLLPGDVIEVATSVRLAVHGVDGELAVDATRAADALRAQGLALGAPSVTTTGLAGTGRTGRTDGTAWRTTVTEADDGALVTATVALPVSPALDAAAQGRRLDLSTAPITWDLTQKGTP